MKEERFFYKYIVVSKAIGDFIAFDSFLTDTEKINLKEIIYVSTNESITHFECIDKSKFYNKNYKKTIIKPANNIENKNIEIKKALINSYFDKNPEIERDKVLIDWNFYKNNSIQDTTIKNYSFVKEKLCEVDKFKLPNEYVSISGWTYSRAKKRVLSIKEWHEIIKTLKKYNIKGVILNNQTWHLENSWFTEILKNENCFINLIGKTTFFEAIEIVKNSKYFMGIDSCLSIIATQSLPEDAIKIKSNKGSGSYKLSNYFYSNLKTKKCLVESIKEI